MKKLMRLTAVLLLLVGCNFLYHTDAIATDTAQEVIQYEDGSYAEITVEQFSNGTVKRTAGLTITCSKTGKIS